MTVTESVNAVLTEWQAAYQFEAYIAKISVSTPPVTPSGPEGAYLWEQEPGPAIGMALSGRMVRLIGHHENYGMVFPVRRSLSEWERKCRREHARWPDHRDRPVCAELAWGLIRDRASMVWLCDQLDVSIGRADRLVALALEYMRNRQSQWLGEVRNVTPHDRDMCAVCRGEDSAAA